MSDDLDENAEEVMETSYDIVIYGTGIEESLLACAFTKCGLKVLVIERYEEYGGLRNNMHWTEFNELAGNKVFKNNIMNSVIDTTLSNIINDDLSKAHDFIVNNMIHLQNRDDLRIINSDCLENISIDKQIDVTLVEKELDLSTSTETHLPIISIYDTMNSLSRQFSIELNCKLLLSYGAMLDVLINSGVYRYLEFCALESIYFISSTSNITSNSQPTISNIPSSKSEIFQSKVFSMIEKRTMMKFLQFASDWGRYHVSGYDNKTLNEHDLTNERSLYRPQNKKDYESYQYNIEEYQYQPFDLFLENCKISNILKTILIHPLALQFSSSTSASQALTDLYLHMSSLGRYGATAFLYPHYGLSELNQAFSRMSAVWGCTQMLRTTITNVLTTVTSNITSAFSIEDEKEVKQIQTSDGYTFDCKYFICESTYWPQEVIINDKVNVTRVSICTEPLLPVSSGGSAFLVIPPYSEDIQNTTGLFVVQHGQSSRTTPSGYYKIHITTTCIIIPDDDLALMMEKAMQYILRLSIHSPDTNVELAHITTVSSCRSPSPTTTANKLPINVFLCGGGEALDESIHYEHIVARAKQIFSKICPNKEFFAASLSTLNGGEETEEDAEELQNLNTSFMSDIANDFSASTDGDVT